MSLVRRFGSTFLCGVFVLLAIAVIPGMNVLNGAETAAGFQLREFTDDTGTYKYTLYVPPNYTPDKAWPVVLFLHGAGERGDDGVQPSHVGLGAIIRRQKTPFPAIVIFPQVPNQGRILGGWAPDRPAGKRALAILKQIEAEYHTDPARRALTGWSMGGFGTWLTATAYPEMWSTVMPMSAGGGPDFAPLKSSRLWAFHGSKDHVVTVERSRKSIAGLRAAGGTPEYTELPVGHDVWQYAYSRPEVQEWLLSTSGAPPQNIDWTAAVERSPALESADAFVLKAVVPRAIGLRLGNEALETLASGLPQAIRPELLTGKLEPIVKTFDVGGRAYRAEFSDLTYSARLANAHLQAERGGDLSFEFDLQRITLKVGKIRIASATLTVQASPIEIVLGHLRPVPLRVRIRPRIEKEELKFQEVKTTFEVASDNWYVSRPETIRRQGTGLTEYELTTGIVGGVYLQKEQIEAEIRGLVPGLLRRMENQLAVDVPSELSSMLWPLPVQAPRLRIRPDELWINGNGLTMIATALVGTSTPAVQPPRRFEGSGIDVSTIPAGRELSIWASPRLVEAGSAIQIDEKMARINVLDLPENLFHTLAEPSLWPGIQPAAGDSLLDVDLQLLEPMRLATARGADGSLDLILTAPRSSLTPLTPTGKPIAERAVHFQVEHRIRVALLRPAYSDRDLEITWGADPKIVAEETDGASQEVVQKFAEGWRKWTQKQSGENPIKDLQVGDSRLRIEAIQAAEPLLVIRFDSPAIRLVNEGGKPFRYRVRDLESYWSGWLSLPAGTVHEFSAPSGLEWQSRDGNQGRFLPGQEIRIGNDGPAAPATSR